MASALLAALSLAAALAAGETALAVESMALEIRNAQVEDLSHDHLIEVVFRQPRGLAYLVRVLDQHTRPELRKEALFWIGQSNQPDALETITRILNQ